MIISQNSPLWSFLDSEQKDLLTDTEYLINETDKEQRVLTDYSFLVFSVAKIYEGFLKKLFFNLGLITQEEYKGERFRVGKALNPQLDQHLRHESIYDRLISYRNDKNVPDELWAAWKSGRNLIFHYFPDHRHNITKEEALNKINQILKAMENAVNCYLGEGKTWKDGVVNQQELYNISPK